VRKEGRATKSVLATPVGTSSDNVKNRSDGDNVAIDGSSQRRMIFLILRRRIMKEAQVCAILTMRFVVTMALFNRRHDGVE